jgi:hypothetical protein
MHVAPDGAAVETRTLEGPRSRYTMFVAYHLMAEDLPKEQQKWQHLSEEHRQLYRDYRIPRNRYIVSAAWQAEVCPKTKRPHIQGWIETKNKTPTPVEILHFLGFQDRNAVGIKHPYNPKAGRTYCMKENSRAPGAEPHAWGAEPPEGEFPKVPGESHFNHADVQNAEFCLVLPSCADYDYSELYEMASEMAAHLDF